MSLHSRTALLRDERGMALALAMFGIIVIAALVAGGFVAGRMEMSSGRNAVYSAQAAEAAEAGLNDAFMPWNGSWNGLTNLEISVPVTSAVIPGVSSGVQYTQTVTRLNSNLFLVRSVGERLSASGQVLASRSLARLARTDPTNFSPQAAVTANGEVRVQGNAIVSGVNTIPLGWDGECPAVNDTVHAVRTSDTVTQNGNAQIIGAPTPTQTNDSTINSATFAVPFAQFAAMANPNLTFGGGPTVTRSSVYPRLTATLPTECDETDPDNWGEPYRLGTPGYQADCLGYMPVVYYTGTGTLHIQGGGSGATSRRSAGVILSAGNISMAGAFEFTGIIMAMGSVTATGNGVKVTGAVYSANTNLDDDMIGGTPVITYSSCVLTTVLNSVSRATPLDARNWSQRW